MAVGVHPVPSRTRSLSPPAPMVLGGQPPGRVGRRQPPPACVGPLGFRQNPQNLMILPAVLALNWRPRPVLIPSDRFPNTYSDAFGTSRFFPQDYIFCRQKNFDTSLPLC